VHDLLRFLDFRDGGYAGGDDAPDDQKHWEHIRSKYPRMKHEPACAAFLRERGYDALGTIVSVHGLVLPSPERRTIEQQLLFYADKRVMVDKRVTLEERFADFERRYGGGVRTRDAETWYREATDVEQRLFPGGCPV